MALVTPIRQSANTSTANGKLTRGAQTSGGPAEKDMTTAMCERPGYGLRGEVAKFGQGRRLKLWRLCQFIWSRNLEVRPLQTISSLRPSQAKRLLEYTHHLVYLTGATGPKAIITHPRLEAVEAVEFLYSLAANTHLEGDSGSRKSTVFEAPSQVRFTKRGEQWAYGSSVVHMMESRGHTATRDSGPRSDFDTVGDILSLENETPNPIESLLGFLDLQSSVVIPEEAWVGGQWQCCGFEVTTAVADKVGVSD
ncbi:hypothetical protein CFIO01_11957 [Colletotrichum fioriniae PJ7]|uniref:Uncharacterized protein n=1 Tax=Colletotrichum fioriniae PJ7 TaxID=1445577 RepID=A0A010RKS3_9PEZI|nr:hypothetical protein CFIO01_11957 [Colletotrichum fioriniae PJ7]